MSWLFRKNKPDQESMIPWRKLEENSQLDEIVKLSSEKPQIIFKHSTRCGRSSAAMSRLEGEWAIDSEDMNVWYLDLLAHRDISNEIADRFGVRHQSPQIIIIKDGEVTYDNSHEAIKAQAIAEHL